MRGDLSGSRDGRKYRFRGGEKSRWGAEVTILPKKTKSEKQKEKSTQANLKKTGSSKKEEAWWVMTALDTLTPSKEKEDTEI